MRVCLGQLVVLLFFFFNDTATTEIYTLSLHDALPIYVSVGPLPTTRLAPRERRLRPDHRPGPRVGLGARNRRRSVLAVQHAVGHQRPDQHRLPGRPPPHLPPWLLVDATPPVPPELAPRRP